jgi:hypothetical protein
VRGRIGAVICLGAMALGAFVAAGAWAQEPRLDIPAEQRTWDLGAEYPTGLPADRTAKHTFTLMNTGTETAEIGEVTSAQPFLAIEVPKHEVEPGGEAPITVTVNASAMEPSQFEAYIEVAWNNPAPSPKPLVLTVKGRVIPEPETLFLLTPRERNIGAMYVGESRDVSFTYENAGTTDFDVYPVILLGDTRFSVKENIVLGPCPRAKPGTFTLTYTPQEGDGGKEINAIFVVKTTAPGQEAVVCRVRGYVIERPEGVQVISQFTPERKNRDGTMSSPPKASFRVVNNTDRAIEVVTLRGDEEVERVTVSSFGNYWYFPKPPVASEDEFKEFSFRITPYAAEPAPAQPETGAGDGGAVEEGSGGGASGGEGAVEGSTEEPTGSETGPADGGTSTTSPDGEEGTAPVDGQN